jgi:hypothetical protein
MGVAKESRMTRNLDSRLSYKSVAVAAALSMLASLILISPSSADVAPPHQPPGSNLEPGAETTQVRMVAEKVVINVLEAAPTDSLGQARVTTNFTMHNLGNLSETMAARFPIAFSDGFSSYPEIKNIEIRVDGKQTTYRRVDGPELYYGDIEVPWAEFEVTFPTGTDVLIQVAYDLEGTGEIPFIAFYYLLQTGAGWKDDIGSGEIIVRLPYEANPQNVILDEQIGWSQTSAGATFSGREITWRFENLEPDDMDNFEVSLVMPSVWAKILVARNQVATNAGDGEAWGRLGKAYKEIWTYRRGFRQDPGGVELYQLAIEAYKKAVTLLPNDALWHAGFADLLSIHAYYAGFEQDATSESLQALREIEQALQIDPSDPKVQEIALNMSYLFPLGMQPNGQGFVFPWLTATPLPPTEGSLPTEPTQTEEAQTPTSQPPLATKTASQPIVSFPCGSATIPFILAAAFIFRGTKSRVRDSAANSPLT